MLSPPAANPLIGEGSLIGLFQQKQKLSADIFKGIFKIGVQLRKYFIFKESLNANNEVEGGSELLTYIENEGQEGTLKDNWTSTLK